MQPLRPGPPPSRPRALAPQLARSALFPPAAPSDRSRVNAPPPTSRPLTPPPSPSRPPVPPFQRACMPAPPLPAPTRASPKSAAAARKGAVSRGTWGPPPAPPPKPPFHAFQTQRSTRPHPLLTPWCEGAAFDRAPHAARRTLLHPSEPPQRASSPLVPPRPPTSRGAGPFPGRFQADFGPRARGPRPPSESPADPGPGRQVLGGRTRRDAGRAGPG